MFESGVLAIRHWLTNNQIRNNRYPETYYKEEKKNVFMNTDSKTYYINDDNGLPDGLPLVALDKIKYSKKNGKSVALYYYNKTIKNGESFNVIGEELDNYIKYIEEKGTQDIFIKNASTWFKSECWNDEYETNNYYFNDVF